MKGLFLSVVNFIKIREIKLFDFLKDHTKKPTSDSSPTHTRIGDKDSKIAGGAYYIPDEKWDMFMDLYWNDVIQKKKPEYLTEKQLENHSPIAVDLDLHFPLDFNERYYSQEHLDDLVDLYLGEIKEMFQFDEHTAFSVYVFEKENLNLSRSKSLSPKERETKTTKKKRARDDASMVREMREYLTKRVKEEDGGKRDEKGYVEYLEYFEAAENVVRENERLRELLAN